MMPATAVRAQKLQFEQLTIRQGLPSGEVYNLYEDSKGYIWACTEYGIVKHNGTRFVPVCKNIPFEESAFYVIRESVKGDLYLANSRANIYRVKHDSAFLVKGMESISKKIIDNKEVMFDMLIDEHSGIYFNTYNNSYLFSGNKVICLNDKYANDSGTLYLKKIGKDYILVKSKIANHKKHCLKVIDENGRLIIQTTAVAYYNCRHRIRQYNQSFCFVNDNQVTLRDSRNRTRTIDLKHPVINLELTPEGAIWVGTSGGLYQLDTNLNIQGHYFSDCVVSDILFDHRNGVWISTIEKGVYYCSNRNNLYYQNIENLSSKISLLKKVNNRFFIGTSDGSLFEKRHKRLVKLNQGDNKASIMDMTYFNGSYIVGTKSYTYILDRTISLARCTSLVYQGKFSSNYCFANDGNTLIFISPTKVFEYKDNRTRLLAVNVDRPVCIAGRKTREYLLGTTNGLLLLKDMAYYRPDFLFPLKNKTILNLLPDKTNKVWICTKGHGLYQLLPDNRLIAFRNIPSNVVNSINVIHDSILLLSTDKGLFMNHLNMIHKSASWKLLISGEITQAEMVDDDIFIATKQGLVTINKDKALFPRVPSPRFYLESVTTNDRKMDPGNIRLSHNENNIYFNFDILAYETHTYTVSYELEGPDMISGITTGRQLYLHNLQPGYYTLSAKPFYAGIDDQHTVIRIPFYIKPAFWQTKIFLIGLLVLFTGTLFFIMQNIKRKEKRKAEIMRKLAEYRLTAVKAQINPHFISNSLAAIQQLIIMNDADKAGQYLAKFSLFLRYCLKYSDKYATYLSDEIRLIGMNVELEQLRFGNQFIFEKDISEDVFPDEIYVPPLITQPIIENAIWHGLLPLNGKRTPKLTLKIGIVDEKLIISIIDNGVGRQNTRYDTNDITNRESRGSWLIRNWIENLNQLSTVKGTEVTYTDLLDDRQNPLGTKVDIIFPIEALNRLHNEKDTISNY